MVSPKRWFGTSVECFARGRELPGRRDVTTLEVFPGGIRRLFPSGIRGRTLPIREVYVTRIPSGGSRGGHWHRKKHEWVAALNGPVVATLISRTGRNLRRRVLHPLKEILYIPPGVGHSFWNRGKRYVELLILSTTLFDPLRQDKVPLRRSSIRGPGFPRRTALSKLPR
jgi:hypothetical protein